mgnify:FL=1
MKTLKFRGAVLALAAVVVFAVAAGAAVLFLDFYGYDYWNPTGCYNALGYVPWVDSDYLTFDYANNEYTFYVTGACISQADTMGTFVILTFSGGTFDVYGDPLVGGTAADYGATPPNAVAPSTWTDGTLEIGADITSMAVYFDLATGEGSVEGTVNFVRGAQLNRIPKPQRTGWTLAGLRAFPLPGTPVPEGYSWQIDGSLFLEEPVATEPSTWGNLKHKFLGEE